MRSTGSSTTSSPGRRALHERTSSQTNEVSPPQSLRAVSDKHNGQEDECDVYTATPYPTKPEHILLPRPGKGQEFIPDSRFHVEEMPNESSATLSTEISHILDSSLIEQSTGDPWDLSSTFDAANTPPQVWEDDPASSKSSLPESGPTEHREVEFKSDDVSYSDEEPNTLPGAAPTIKTVVSDTSSGQPPHPANAASSNSSPNVVPIGPSSSPNFVALDSSSLNFVPIGASSNPDSGSRSNSLSSLNSLGTVIRYIGAAPWTHGSSSEQSSSRSYSFRSNPPYQGPSARSNSTRARERSHSRSITSSSRSDPSSDIQAIVDSGVFLQYPTIHAPSSASSRVDVSHSADSLDNTQHETTADGASEHFKSHLSTVTSRWSAEYDSRSASPADRAENTPEPSRPTAAHVRQRPTSSSVWLINSTDGDEYLDDVSSLPARPANPAVPSSHSSGSRQSSVRSTKRPGTSSSLAFNVLPTWAKMYYGQPVGSALSLVEGSRPSSARPTTPNSNPLHRLTTAATRPRTRTNETGRSIRWMSKPDPRDPRSHWVKGPEVAERPGHSRHQLRHSWSPHLYPDRRNVRPRGSAWGAPSMDSRTEPFLGRRNIQVWSFCLGFVFPLGTCTRTWKSQLWCLLVFSSAWLIAAFLPLPPKPEMILQEDSEPGREKTLQMRVLDLERKRYENARWWRNLNRWMIPLGLVIITIIITLAVVGTKVGF
ncbi:hypothetical protein F9C07_2093518 [Aspergillus flavus]|uniref:Uncharacterized protein n=2 Tax=Aspergillus flavus TaxID=5059 RepID=B8ND39_ASPFN|nr:uncharacterized protein G4B84_008190 [Aspergillus flavus NRRL3357]KAB8243305.1 hypothetical protein BDV35DRAFT_363350 [Aspergillus flavus]QMW32759.1 hypothetical protein G4B84_008190 [Aspergillus flavus NRRL3357]QMW44789.1 hypothetical protein G4B11_008209 [Aspergillus flavus]QRD84280.1 hypothetical protein F9C07_2093518 [Aspergillus flavus]